MAAIVQHVEGALFRDQVRDRRRVDLAPLNHRHAPPQVKLLGRNIQPDDMGLGQIVAHISSDSLSASGFS